MWRGVHNADAQICWWSNAEYGFHDASEESAPLCRQEESSKRTADGHPSPSQDTDGGHTAGFLRGRGGAAWLYSLRRFPADGRTGTRHRRGTFPAFGEE